MDKKILIVDDEPDILKTLEKVLIQEGFQVRCATGGEEALGIFRGETFDLVITDIRMPGMDGVEVLRQVKQLDRDTEVIILTGFATLENAINTLRDDGAFDYLTKPLEHIDELLVSVNQALERRSLKEGNKRLFEELKEAKQDLERKVEDLGREITRRKKMEKELLQAKKSEAIAMLAGGVAHDFNNLLTTIMGNISLAQKHVKPDDRIFGLLSEAESASFEAEQLIGQFIAFSETGLPVKKPVSIAQMMEHSVRLALADSDIRCNFSMPSDLWQVTADEGQISQTVHNLVTNAKEAMPKGGVIEVSAENIVIDAPLNDLEWSLEKGKYIKLSIKDAGVGIPKDHLTHIFDPYFSTKERCSKKGMGLGLAIAYNIVKNHEGHIQLISEVGAGTTAHIYLPAVKH